MRFQEIRLTQKEFENLINYRFEKCRSVLLRKKEEYAEDDDMLRNFNNAACTLEMEPEQVAFMYMMKHFQSIKDLLFGKKKLTNDLWEEKITDLINYLLIIDSIIRIKLNSK